MKIRKKRRGIRGKETESDKLHRVRRPKASTTIFIHPVESIANSILSRTADSKNLSPYCPPTGLRWVYQSVSYQTHRNSKRSPPLPNLIKPRYKPAQYENSNSQVCRITHYDQVSIFKFF